MFVLILPFVISVAPFVSFVLTTTFVMFASSAVNVSRTLARNAVILLLTAKSVAVIRIDELRVGADNEVTVPLDALRVDTFAVPIVETSVVMLPDTMLPAWIVVPTILLLEMWKGVSNAISDDEKILVFPSCFDIRRPIDSELGVVHTSTKSLSLPMLIIGATSSY
jgi:hypothetical protein